MSKDGIAALLEQLQKDFSMWRREDAFASVCTLVGEPSSALLRGDGVAAGKGCIYDSGFRRYTTELLVRLHDASPIAFKVDVPSPLYHGRHFAMAKSPEVQAGGQTCSVIHIRATYIRPLRCRHFAGSVVVSSRCSLRKVRVAQC